MSASGALWVVLAVSFLLMSFRRPVWAVAFYLQTFFAAPYLWWWGDDLPSLRYSLLAGFVLLLSVALAPASLIPNRPNAATLRVAAIAIVVNAVFVHLVFAANSTISAEVLVELAKFILLFFMISSAIKDRDDLHRVIATIAIGAAYIGWEVAINDRGTFTGSRLEGVGAPAANTANSLANVMLVALPLAGSLFLQKSWKWKLTSVVAAPLILNLLLLCNSRGAFLGLIGTGVAFVLAARGQTRKRALQTMALGGIALFLLLGDPRILERFMTTFTGSEARDNSAAGRLEFWQAGAALLADYPLGAGGGAFKFTLGVRYLGELLGTDDVEARALHNGYLTEATDWGVQGLFLKLGLFLVAIVGAYRTTEKCRRENRIQDALLGLCITTTAFGYLIHNFFGSFLDHEWGYWILALLVRYAALFDAASASAADSADTAIEARSRPIAAA